MKKKIFLAVLFTSLMNHERVYGVEDTVVETYSRLCDAYDQKCVNFSVEQKKTFLNTLSSAEKDQFVSCVHYLSENKSPYVDKEQLAAWQAASPSAPVMVPFTIPELKKELEYARGKSGADLARDKDIAWLSKMGESMCDAVYAKDVYADLLNKIAPNGGNGLAVSISAALVAAFNIKKGEMPHRPVSDHERQQQIVQNQLDSEEINRVHARINNPNLEHSVFVANGPSDHQVNNSDHEFSQNNTGYSPGVGSAISKFMVEASQRNGLDFANVNEASEAPGVTHSGEDGAMLSLVPEHGQPMVLESDEEVEKILSNFITSDELVQIPADQQAEELENAVEDAMDAGVSKVACIHHIDQMVTETKHDHRTKRALQDYRSKILDEARDVPVSQGTINCITEENNKILKKMGVSKNGILKFITSQKLCHKKLDLIHLVMDKGLGLDPKSMTAEQPRTVKDVCDGLTILYEVFGKYANQYKRAYKQGTIAKNTGVWDMQKSKVLGGLITEDEVICQYSCVGKVKNFAAYLSKKMGKTEEAYEAFVLDAVKEGDGNANTATKEYFKNLFSVPKSGDVFDKMTDFFNDMKKLRSDASKNWRHFIGGLDPDVRSFLISQRAKTARFLDQEQKKTVSLKTKELEG